MRGPRATPFAAPSTPEGASRPDCGGQGTVLQWKGSNCGAEMQDTELFIHLAEIAGVFVGFGSLLAFRTGDLTDVHAVEYLRSMVGSGLWVVLAALAPVALSRFGVAGRGLWVPCSLLALILFITYWAADARSPENRAERTFHRRETVRYAAVAMPMTVGLLGMLLLIVVGSWQRQDQALYFAAVTLGLLETGMGLIALVWTQARGDTSQVRRRIRTKGRAG